MLRMASIHLLYVAEMRFDEPWHIVDGLHREVCLGLDFAIPLLSLQCDKHTVVL